MLTLPCAAYRRAGKRSACGTSGLIPLGSLASAHKSARTERTRACNPWAQSTCGASPRACGCGSTTCATWRSCGHDNPAREVKAPKLPKRHPGALSTDEVSRLIQAAVEHSRTSERLRNWTLIAFLFHTGLRVSELCGLRVSDVQHRNRLPHSIRVIGKGNKERRVILSAEAKRSLYQWLQERAHIEAAAPLEVDASFVWLVPAGKRRGEGISPSGVRALLRHLAPLANLTKRVHPHLLRHSFATEAVRRGAKIHGLKEMLGHASIATTGVYLHADEDELEQVAAVMPSVLEGGTSRA